LGRIINPERTSQSRNQLSRSVVLALRELALKSDIDEETYDLAAFIGLALITIWQGIESSIIPWEKRGYWVKADRFRMEWNWSERLGLEMQQAVLHEDWPQIAILTGKVAERLAKVKLPQRHRLGKPWIGAWRRLKDQSP